MRVYCGDLHQNPPLRDADVDHSTVSMPREYQCRGLGRRQTSVRHATHKGIECSRIGIERRIVPGPSRSTLWMPSSKRSGQITPVWIDARIEVLEIAADVGRFGAVEIEIS